MGKDGSEKKVFVRGMAAGSILMAVISLTSVHISEYIDNGTRAEGYYNGRSAAGRAAEIISEAMMLSDGVMNRKIEEKDISAIVTGAMHALDPYSGYVDKAFADRIIKGSEMDAEGYMIGILGDVANKGYFVRSTIPLSPAEGSGLLSGDRLISIDELDVSDMTGIKALAALKNATSVSKGVAMSLGFERNGEKFHVTLSPAIIHETYAFDMGLVDGSVHILVQGFFSGVSDEVDRIIARHVKNGPVDGIIFDLRGNGGGLVDETMKMASMVMPSGTLLYSEEGLHIKKQEHRTTVEPKYKGYKLAVLIDEGSASASEIFASAVQANDLGIVVGKISFGKGTIQNVYPFLDNSGALKITVGEYKDPKGRTINGVGVFPDFIVDAVTNKIQSSDPTFDTAIKEMRYGNG